ncbi:hypothetical protein HDU97_010355 [Phlyctochytrium planicorne]|nr:hypothetical protein HDU97_010355 [Phlyctochytrium planicorne]
MSTRSPLLASGRPKPPHFDTLGSRGEKVGHECEDVNSHLRKSASKETIAKTDSAVSIQETVDQKITVSVDELRTVIGRSVELQIKRLRASLAKKDELLKKKLSLLEKRLALKKGGDSQTRGRNRRVIFVKKGHRATTSPQLPEPSIAPVAVVSEPIPEPILESPLPQLPKRVHWPENPIQGIQEWIIYEEEPLDVIEEVDFAEVYEEHQFEDGANEETIHHEEQHTFTPEKDPNFTFSDHNGIPPAPPRHSVLSLAGSLAYYSVRALTPGPLRRVARAAINATSKTIKTAGATFEAAAYIRQNGVQEFVERECACGHRFLE